MNQFMFLIFIKYCHWGASLYPALGKLRQEEPMFKSNLGYIAKPYLKTCLNIFKKNTSGLTIACLLSFLISILFPET
jgi:hypothetical protein